MPFLASLRNRIFLASTLVAILPLVLAFRYVSGRVTQEAEAELQRGLGVAARRVAEHQRERVETLTTVARLVADLPKLKAAVATQDPPTVRPLAEDYRARAGADVMIVTGRGGEILAVAGTTGLATASRGAVDAALAGGEATTLETGPGGLFQLVTVPILVGPEPVEVLGAASLGFRLDDAQAAHFEGAAGAEVAIVFAGRIWASSMPGPLDPLLALPPGGNVRGVVLGAEEYAVATAPLGAGAGADAGPVALVLRSRTASQRILAPLRTALLGAGAAALAVAVLLSLLLAQTVTRPLAALTARMREIARTGDLSPRREAEGRWDDEDARLLARSFQALTGALARFQAEAAQRERLSALGRLSTVIAHEIRNPLMIVKAALRTVRRDGETRPGTREAVAEMDQELGRIDRIVGDVLDYARPPRLQLAPADLGAVCRGAIAAAATDGLRVDLEVAPGARAAVTDADRLQGVLVNVLANARDAVRAARPGPSPGVPDAADIRVTVREEGGDRIEVIVSDHGAGIVPEDLPHVFEPYVTRKRTGTGLGLAIARNVVEALGGSIEASSVPGSGTSVRIRLPREARVPVEPPAGAAAARTREA